MLAVASLPGASAALTAMLSNAAAGMRYLQRHQHSLSCARNRVLAASLTWRPSALGLLRLLAGWVLAGDGVCMLHLLCLRHGECFRAIPRFRGWRRRGGCRLLER